MTLSLAVFFDWIVFARPEFRNLSASGRIAVMVMEVWKLF